MPNNYISQIQTPDNTIYKIKDAQAARKENGVYYIVGSANDEIGAWTGTNAEITEYYEGLVVVYLPQVQGSSTSGETTLNINNLGACVCYASTTAPIRTDYPANCNVTFVYHNQAWIKTSVTDGLEHTLTIGNYVFDGTQNITIPVYDVP